MNIVVEEMVTVYAESGNPIDVGWKTDMHTKSRYWAGRRWSELVAQDRVPRLVDGRGDLLPVGA